MATLEDKEDLLLSCRYGELDQVQRFTEKFGTASLGDVKDENGNSILHMVCGNGHEGMALAVAVFQTLSHRLPDILDYILPLVSPSLLSASNHAGSTPLHWASLNCHLPIVKMLVLFPQGPGSALIDAKNSAGRSPLGEAELAGWEDGAQWLVGQMNLEEGGGASVGKEDAGGADLEAEVGDIEVEIEDAEGGVAKMRLGQERVKEAQVPAKEI